MSKGKVILPMKIGDFSLKKGTVKEELKRGVVINDKNQDLTVVKSMNHKKGTFSISVTWNMDAITNNDLNDTTTLTAISQLMMAARDQCILWRDGWKKENVDDDQMDMGFGDEE